MLTTILIDMDEVLTDFVGAYCKYVYGITRQDLEKYWEPGTYGMQLALSKYTGKEITEEDFYKAINNQVDFWENMPWTNWGKQIIEVVESYKRLYKGEIDWHIVTSPVHCTSSYVGKTLWLKREFGKEFNNFAITPHKELFAKKGVYLIDDREYNVNKFVKAGGKSYLFPAYHNLHKITYNDLIVIKDFLLQSVSFNLEKEL